MRYVDYQLTLTMNQHLEVMDALSGRLEELEELAEDCANFNEKAGAEERKRAMRILKEAQLRLSLGKKTFKR
jgi:ElaB/YqjD/DUF883 family membrane-anchored ribosome-binding protein